MYITVMRLSKGCYRHRMEVIKPGPFREIAEDEVVVFGSTVTVQMDGEQAPETFQIVTPEESDPSTGRISNETPLACALFGKKGGDIFFYTAPGGEQRGEVLSVSGGPTVEP